MADFNPDAYLSQKQGAAGPTGFDPDSYLKNKSGGSATEAFIQKFGQAGTLGYLPELQSKAAQYLPNPTAGIDTSLKEAGFNVKEAPQADTYESRLAENRRRDAALGAEHPYASGAGTVAGVVASAPAYGAALNAIPGMGGGIAAKGFLEGAKQGAIAGAKGGAIIGAVSNPNEAPEESGLNIVGRAKNAAMGAGIGGALGGVAGGLIGKYSRPNAAIPEETAGPSEPPGPPSTPTNVKDIQSQVKEFKKSGGTTDLPTGQMLNDIVDRNPDLVKPIPGFHEKMLSSKADYEKLRTLVESPTDAGESIRNYEQMMKSDADSKMSDFISKKAGRDPLDKMEAGDQLMNDVLAKYNQTKDELAPVFKQFQDMQLPKQKIVPEIREQVANDIPKLKNYLNVNEDTGSLELKPFTPKMGITSESHAVLSKVVDALNSKQLSFEDMQNIREYLRQSMDPINPKATKVLGDARKSLLDYMDTLVGERSEAKQIAQGKGPYEVKPLDVRGTFKSYAQNEKNLDQVETIIGGKLENFDQLITARPERVLDRIFSSPTNIKVMRNVLGEEKVGQLGADYLNNLVERSTDKGILRSQRLSSFIKQKEYSLKEALSPKDFQRASDLTDYMRLVPDTPSANPSGTARSAEILKSIMGGHPLEAVKGVGGAIKDIGANRAVTSQVNQMMAPGPLGQGNIYKPGLLNTNITPTGSGRVKP